MLASVSAAAPVGIGIGVLATSAVAIVADAVAARREIESGVELACFQRFHAAAMSLPVLLLTSVTVKVPA